MVSDSHDRTDNFRKAVLWAEKKGTDLFIHCGDITRVSTWEKAMAGFSGESRISLGNADPVLAWKKKKKEKKFETRVFSDFGEVEAGGGKIAFTHSPKKARALAEKGKYQIIFYGHTHKPWMEEEKGVKLLNPGNLAGSGFPATFCYFFPEQQRLRLKSLRNLNLEK